MVKRTSEEYLIFFRDYNPTFNQCGDGYDVFTFPTQWSFYVGEYLDVIDAVMDFIEDGRWKPKETPLFRFMNNFPPLTDEDFDILKNIDIDETSMEKYFEEHVRPHLFGNISKSKQKLS